MAHASRDLILTANRLDPEFRERQPCGRALVSLDENTGDLAIVQSSLDRQLPNELHDLLVGHARGLPTTFPFDLERADLATLPPDRDFDAALLRCQNDPLQHAAQKAFAITWSLDQSIGGNS
jgi:hypothetical protein